MSHREGRPVARTLVSLASLVALVVAVPAGLIVASRARFGSGWPWDGVRPPWSWNASEIGGALGDRLADDTVIDVIVRVALTTVWLALIVVVATTLAEIVHVHRHGGLSVPAVRGLGWAQRIARFIAAGLIAVTPVVTPLATMAGSPSPPRLERATVPAAPAIIFDADVRVAPPALPEHPTDRAGAAEPDATPDHPVHVVERGESVYSIAALLAGGDARRTEDIAMTIIDLNLGTEMAGGQRFTNPAYIEPGWELRLPDAGTSATSPIPPAPHRAPDVETHTVAVGDTLSGIAAEHLGDSAGWHEIWADNSGARMPDGRTFDDPNLILPGWELDVSGADDPPRGVPRDVAEVVVTGTPASDTAPDVRTGDAGRAVEVVSSPAPRPPMTSGPAPAAASPAPTRSAPRAAAGPDRSAGTGAVVPTTSDVLAGGLDGDGATADDHDEPAAPSPLRLEHAALLAAGILALVAVRRRSRLRGARPRSRVPDPHPDVNATERRLRIIEPGERALRTDVALRSAASHIFEDAQIGLVEVSREGDITLTLNTPSELPAPWEGAATRWTLPATVPVELLSASARQVGAPCLALVQLGTTADGHDLLVDLEACGTLAIDAPAAQGDEVVAGLAAGLASSIHAEVAHLIGVGCPPEAFLGHRNTHRADDVDAALDLAASLVGTTLSSERSSFEMRSLHTGGEMWEPAIVLLTSEDDADGAALRPIPPGQGCAVVAVTGTDGMPSAPTRLVGRPEGWVLEAFGSKVPMQPVGLDPSDLGEVTALLDDADGPLLDAELRPADDPSTPGHADADRTSPTEPFEARQHAVVVHLLDGVAIRSREGESAHFERSKTVELIAWLATHRGRMTRTAARTALWELDVRDATFANVVSEARRGLARLVEPPEGEEWLARTLTEELPLHDFVVTDADLIEERMAAARLQPPTEAIETLRTAVELIEGMPFAGTSYLWPDADGITSNILLLATGAATELAAHALAIGDTELVFWATGRALQVLPGHEELVGLRMRAHAHAGDLAAVRQEWESYERVIIADAWSDGEPAPKLVELRHELLSRGS